MSTCNNATDILFPLISKKRTVKRMIYFIAKLRMYIVGTVRMFWLHMIMMITVTLPVVPNLLVLGTVLRN